MTVDFLLCSHASGLIIFSEPQERHCTAGMVLVSSPSGATFSLLPLWQAGNEQAHCLLEDAPCTSYLVIKLHK